MTKKPLQKTLCSLYPPRDACKEGAPEWAIASAGVAAMKVFIIFKIFIIHFSNQRQWIPHCPSIDCEVWPQ